MRRRCDSWRCILSLITVTYLFAAALPVHAQEEQEGYRPPAITVGERIFGLGWDSASSELYVENARKERKRIRVTYRGERNEKVTSLIISAERWRADLSQYVAGLSYPFPSRILMTVDGVDESLGPLPRLVLSLPYAVIIPERDDAPAYVECGALDVVILNGRGLDTATYETGEGRCVQ